MADLVGLDAKSPDVMGTLGQLLNLKHQQAVIQQEQQDARQRANIAGYDWNKHMGPDGVLDASSFANDPSAPIIFGDKYVDFLTHASQAQQQGLAAKQSLLNTNSAFRKEWTSVMTGLLSDKDVAGGTPVGHQKLNDAIINFDKQYGKEGHRISEIYGPQLQHVSDDQLPNALRAMQAQAQSAEQQSSLQQPNFVSSGGKLNQTNLMAPGRENIPLTLSPGFQVVQDANGRSFAINPQTNEVRPLGTGTAGAGAGAGAGGGQLKQPPNKPTFVQPVAGQKDLETHVSEVRSNDTDYGTNQHINDELLRLSSNTSTGPGSAVWHTGALGKITGTFGGNPAADYQKIGAFLDRQAAMSAKQMGLPDTNAGLQTAASLSGTTEYTPEALQTKVKLTDALVEGAHQYRQGLDKVVGTGGNQDLSNLNTFRSQWADNFDPNVFRAERAIARGDKKELATLKEEVGTRGMTELKKKSDNLEKLSRGELLE